MKNRASIFLGALPILFTAVFMTGCPGKALPPAESGEVIDYFVNPTPEKLARLSEKSGDTATLNAAFRAMRGKAAPAPIHEWLTDTAGFSYLVGGVTPKTIAADSLYPLMIYLHGGTGSERNDKGDSAWSMFKDLTDTFNLFIVSPSANRYAPWWSPAGLSRILQTLRYMTLHYPIDPNRVFLSGVSDGATGCYAAANTIPAPFAGFIAVSGFGGMLPMLGFPLLPENLRQRPIYNVNAGHDRIYSVDEVRTFVEALQENGVPVTAKFYPDEQHGFDYRAREMGTIAGLLRQWSRPRPAGFVWNMVDGFPNDADNLIGWADSGANARIQGQMQNDTLKIRSQGVGQVAFTLPGQSGKLVCNLLSDNGRVRKISPAALAWPENLKPMMHSCFPGFSATTVYKIKF